MKQTLFATLLLAPMVLSACSIKVTDVDSDEKKITKTLKVKDFNSINILGSANVEFYQADTYKVELIATKEAMKGVQTTVKDSVLTISRSNSDNGKDKTMHLKIARGDYRLRISAPTLKAVNISGSGDFYAKTPITAKKFDASVIGSGDLHFGKVTADSISVGISGSGDAEINAFSKAKADFQVTGSGDIEADVTGCADVAGHVSGSGDLDLDLNNCGTFTTSITGSGDIEAELVDCGDVNASASGSGDITLKGNAKSVTTSGKNINTKGLKTKE